MSDVETVKSKQPSFDVYTYNADYGFQCDERDSLAAKSSSKSLGPHTTLHLIVSEQHVQRRTSHGLGRRFVMRSLLIS
jgi:hypothetical protein